ncbi:solute carrier family 38 member 10 isoform X11 [Manis javanica]|uniref:solute carrier family 38 member 10 isoform X11 n=1 Tax=Manis javanica TaxID=9974 RepID=UPI003C6D0C00
MTAAAASNWGLITNIVNSIVGVSVLTMPFCFKQCGIILGALLLVFCSWMTHQSCMFLVKSASLSKRRTYAGLALHAYGKAGKMLVETSMIGLMLGTCIAFYVVIGDLGSNFFARLFGFQVTGTFRVLLLFTVSLCIVLPLSLQRNMMASIQSFSAMALIFYTVFMFVIVLSSLKHGLFGGQWLQRVRYVRWEGVFRCIPIFGMSFACQSQVLPTYDSLDEPSVKTMSSIFASSLNVVTTFYVLPGDRDDPRGLHDVGGRGLPHDDPALPAGLEHTAFRTAAERWDLCGWRLHAPSAVQSAHPLGCVWNNGRRNHDPKRGDGPGPHGRHNGEPHLLHLPGADSQKDTQECALLPGIAVPMGEAHRHEPPIPHDKVVVDEGQDREGLEENEHLSKHENEKSPEGKEQMVPPLPDSERERRGQDQALGAEAGLPEDPQKVPEENGQPAIEPVKEDLGPGNRGLHPGPQAALPERQDTLAVGAGERGAGALPLGPAGGAVEKLEERGGKAPLPVRPFAGAGQAEPREQRHVEAQGGGHPGSRLEAEIKKIVAEAGRVEMLDHAVLLQVIKEQQAQQKRLLDQQEKLLAVIEEQHKEIHQQRQDGEEVDVQPEPGVAAPQGKEQEAQDRGTVGRPPPRPLEPVLRAPGRAPALPQGHGQHSMEDAEVTAGRAPASPPSGADVKPRAALTEPREGQKGAVTKMASFGVQERVPVPDPAGAPGGPEELIAGEFPGQSQDAVDGGSRARKKSGKEAVAVGAGVQEADVLGVGAEIGDPHVKPQQGSQDLAPAGLASRSGGAAPQAQAVLHQPEPQTISARGLGGQQRGQPAVRRQALGRGHGPTPGEDVALQEPEHRQDSDLGPKLPVSGGQKPDYAKPNRDLKVQADSDLRRRRRDVAPGAEEAAPKDRVIISFNRLPDMQVSDLRSALESQLHQAAGGALRMVPGREIKQLPRALEEP